MTTNGAPPKVDPAHHDFTTQNRAAPVLPQPHGGALRPFPPGNRAGGRQKGLVALIKAETDDGAELVAFMLGILRSKRQPTRLRMEAAAWLADRGFGKVTQPLTGQGGAPIRFTLALSAAGAAAALVDADWWPAAAGEDVEPE